MVTVADQSQRLSKTSLFSLFSESSSPLFSPMAERFALFLPEVVNSPPSSKKLS